MNNGLVATEDQYRLAGAVLRKRREVIALHQYKFRKDLSIPTDIEACYKTTKELLASWIESRRQQMPMTFTVAQYEAMAKLAQWLVEKFHSINGTPAPDVKEWGICHQALGAKTFKDTGLAS